MQPGDIVESVDMEMSDDENDSKPKGRVLVDLRSQDRDMRVGAPLSSSSHLDMDMRMIPLPVGQMPGSRGQLVQDVRLMHAGPPPPPPLPQFHQSQSGFRQEQSDFHRGQSADFHSSQSNFHQNRPPPNFLQSSQDFHQNQPDFRSHHQSQQDFHPSQQDFEYRDRQHDIRSKQDFLTELSSRGRYSQSTDHQHRDSSLFHRNDRSNRGSRGFPRNRRDRYSDDHIMKRNLVNSRKSRSQDQQLSPEILPNSRPLLLQPPDTVLILDDEGIPISMPEFDQRDNTASSTIVTAQESRESQERDDSGQSAMLPTRRTSHDTPSSQDSERNQQQQQPQQQQQGYPVGSSLSSDHERAPSSIGSDDQQLMNQVTVIPITTDASDVQQNQYVPVSEYEEHVDLEHSVAAEKTTSDDNGSVHEGQDTSFAENERLTSEQLTTGTNMPNNELKRPSANGSFDEQTHEDASNSNKKRTLLPNGPHIPLDCGPNGGPSPHGMLTELHPVIHEYDGHGSPSLSPNFRLRIGVPTPFPLWRGVLPRGGRGGFRGGPRAPWLDRGPRGPGVSNFPPRGLKRGGGQFHGSGFRGRGRGSNW